MSMDEQSQTLTPPSAANAEALWRQANDLAAQGNLLGAVPLYLEVSDLWPDSPTVWLNLGIVLGALDRHEEALQCLLRAQGLDRNDPHIHYQLGQMHGQLGQLEAAAKSFLAATASDPGYVDAWLGLADLSLQCRETELAQQYLNEVFLIIPDHPAGSFLQGNLFLREGDIDGAAESFAIAYKATHDPACGNNLASVLGQLGRAPEAIDLLEGLLKERPDYKLAWNTLGGLHMGGERYSEAREALMQALQIDDAFHAARHGLARCLVQMRDLLGAQEQLQRLLQDAPDSVSAMKDQAVVLERIGQIDQALALRERAIELDPKDARLLADHANLLQSLHRYAEAEDCSRQALVHDPDELRARMAIIHCCFAADRMAEAQEQLRLLLTSGTQDIPILNTIGTLFERWKEAAKAISVYEHVLSVEPGNSHATIRIFDLKMGICDWTNYDEISQAQIDQIEADFADGAAEKNHFDVFNLQALPVSYDFIGKVAGHAAIQIAADARLNLDAPPLVHAAPRGGRIRLGYALGYTFFHSLPLVMKEVTERHDRDRFEVFGYSLRPCNGGDFSRSYRAAFDHFRDIPETAPYLAAQTINEDAIDILIDVTGLTSINCMPVSSFRPAPVQMHGYGYSITTGADYIDYLITDRTYIPEEWEGVGPEKLLYLPNTFMPTKRPGRAGKAITRAEAGLPEDAVVFSNFNHPCKFEPKIFAAWMEILTRVPGSVLWFGAWLQGTQENLRREAAKFNIDAKRLIFSEIVEHEDHLARLDLVDLALDNLHHGGGVTSVDALWVGLPVLTILGNKPGARLGATLCNAAGVPDMVVPDLPSYVERAVALANDPDQRRALRQRLIEGRDSQPLFDNERYCHNLDNAIEAAWNNYLAGHPPKRIELGE
ncbi:MAG: tetratricopeptide repeat protein [Alphaproteobacteria bacterium]|nr:tetratricopeptide repeat protein [Alphaproteobacteria bacterium]